MPRCARPWVFVGLLMALLTGGCVIQPIAQPATQPREALNHGYAQLHWVANKLQHIDKLQRLSDDTFSRWIKLFGLPRSTIFSSR